MNPAKKAFYLLLVQLLLLGPACFFQQTHGRRLPPVKTSDQYWAETSLDSRELENLILDQKCWSAPKNSLACINAINSAAERFGVRLSADGSFASFQDEKTEKEILNEWQERLLDPRKTKEFSFVAAWKQLSQKFVSKADRAAVVAAGINGYLSVAVDPHTYILPVDMYEQLLSASEAKQDRAGFIYRKLKGRLAIKKVFDGTPAQIAGLRKADEISEINGIAVSKISNSRISEILKFQMSSRIRLLVVRGSESKNFELMKASSRFVSLSAKILPGKRKLGLMTIHKFAKETCISANKELITMMEQGIRGLLIDVRDNPGGQLDEAACILNLFVNKGQLLFETRYLDPLQMGEKYIATKEPIYSGPIAVLINSGSASASEILAGALKDLGRANLVGERTYGKGSFQDGRIWGGNEKVALFKTEGLYYFPSGWTPQLVGLEPDLPIEFNNSELRESELYFRPLQTKDTWTGPQSLAWLSKLECSGITSLEVDSEVVEAEDLQLKEARSWLDCHMLQSSTTRAEVSE